MATCAPARKSQLTQATKENGWHDSPGDREIASLRHARAHGGMTSSRCPTFAHTGQMSADILAKFYGLIFFSAIFIIAAVRVVISRRSQTSPAVLPVSRA